MERPKAFLIELSNKSSLRVDEDELAKVFAGITSGDPVVVRQGLFNPSFFVDIREDRERIDGYLKLTEEIYRKNEQAEKYGSGVKRDMPEFEKLADIFNGVKLLK